MPSRPTRELTPDQLRFAQERGATLGACAAGYARSVYVYRDEGWRTCRWLVDPDGKIMDFVMMRRSMPTAPRFVRDGASVTAANGDTLPVWPSRAPASAAASQ
jgi:hypothetical protein